ncbi:MAG: PQQ-binding-like beta-propeller repeat protein [Planctomycetes bacterium]|nr:PQQ-binding-like beta-propeller repeat protein [Planctomycetota bacterium]
MSFKGDLSTIGLAEVFQMISMSQKEGTLVVQDDESRKAIYFGAEGVQLHSAGKRKGFRLGDILVRAGKITVGQLREVLEQQSGSGRMLGEELASRGLVTAQEIQDVVKSQIEEEIYDLFLWRKASFEFIEGPPIEELQDPETKAIRLSFDVNSLLLEAVRRTDEWTLINQKIPSMDCIYTWVSSAAREEEEAGAPEQTKCVFQYVDGQGTVADVIEQSFVPRFEVCKILVDLLDRGRIRMLSPAELVTVARQRLEEGRRDKGLKLFAVAAQLAPEDPDLIGRYAHALESEGMIQEAARMYVRVGSLLKQQGQGKDALAYFQRAVSLNPDDVQSKIALFEINLATASIDEAIATASELVANCLKERDFETAREIAEQAVAAAPQSLEMRLALAKVYHTLGMKKERDDVVLFLRKNLPVDQAAADRIIAELRDLSEKVAEPSPRTAAGGRRRRGRALNVKRLVLIAGGFAFVVGGAAGGVYEFLAKLELGRRVEEARLLEGENKWDEARDWIRGFQGGAYRFSLLSSWRKEVDRCTERQQMAAVRSTNGSTSQNTGTNTHTTTTTNTNTGTNTNPPDVPTEDEQKQREQALARIHRDLDELIRQDTSCEYDKALATAKNVLDEATKWDAKDDANRAKQIYERLFKLDLEVRTLKAEADRLRNEGRYKDACETIEQLKRVHVFWKIAQDAMVPFAIICRPAGVQIYERGVLIGVSDEKPFIKEVPYGKGRFTLRFEKRGFVAKTVEVVDERVGKVEVWLNEREAEDRILIGSTLLADPVFANGLFHLVMEIRGEKKVFALASRKSPWDERTDTAPRLGPGGYLYFGRGSQVVGVDGSKRGESRVAWEFQAGVRVDTPIGFSERGDTLFFGSGRQLIAVDLAEKKKLWSRELPDEFQHAPVEFGGCVIVGCLDGTLCGVRAQGEAWKLSMSGMLRRAPAMLLREANGLPGGATLFLGGADGCVVAIDAQTGRGLWTSDPLPGDIDATPCVSGGHVFAASTDGTVACFTKKGDERWRVKPGGKIRAGVVVAGGVVLVGDLDGDFHALSAVDGRPSWHYRTGGAIRTAAVVVNTDVYVASDDRNLYVLPLD